MVITGWSCRVPEGAREVLSVRQRWPEAPSRAGRMDRPSVHALLAVHALRASVPLEPSDDVGVIVGTALGCAEANDAYHRGLITHGVEGASPLLFAQTIPSAPAGEVAIAFGLRGHSATVMAGRCAGVAALAEAVRAIRLGRMGAGVVIAGDTFGEDRAALLAARGEAPPGEATVALLVERADHAARAGRSPRAAVTEARVFFEDTPRTPLDIDRLGATGLIELARWLDAGGERLAVDVACPSGRRGTLCAARR